MRLDQLKPGAFATVQEVGGTGAFRRRLLELGVLPGTPIRRTGQAPLGDPMTYRVRGAVIALRRAEAATVRIGDVVDVAAK